MEQTTTATIEVKGHPHRVEARVELLRDRATILVDGVTTPSTLVRRPFSSLFRYRFEVDAMPWELRVSPDGLRSYQLIIVPASAEPQTSGLSAATIAAGSGLPGAIATLGLAFAGVTEAGPAVLIGLGASLGTFAILWMVYGRRQQV